MIRLTEQPRLERLYKMPGELLQDVALDFAAKLLSGETVTAVETDDIGTGLVLATAHAGTVVTLDLGGAANGEQIAITITATGSLGSVRQAVLLVVIRDPRQQVAPVVVAPGTLNWRGGDYAPAGVYRPFDLVLSAGGLWLALRIVTGVAPAPGDDWVLLAGDPQTLADIVANTAARHASGSDAETPTSMGALIQSSGAITTPADADKFSFRDSVSGLLAHVTWANLKAAVLAGLSAIGITAPATGKLPAGTVASQLAALAARVDLPPHAPGDVLFSSPCQNGNLGFRIVSTIGWDTTIFFYGAANDIVGVITDAGGSYLVAGGKWHFTDGVHMYMPVQNSPAHEMYTYTYSSSLRDVVSRLRWNDQNVVGDEVYKLFSGGTLQQTGSIVKQRTIIDDDVEAAFNDCQLRLSTGAIDRVVNLSDLVVGQIIEIKKIDSGTGKISFASTNSCTIDGRSDRQLTHQHESISLRCVVAGADAVFDILAVTAPDWQRLIREGYVASSYPISFDQLPGNVNYLQLFFPPWPFTPEWIAPDDFVVHVSVVEYQPEIVWSSGVGQLLTLEQMLTGIEAALVAGLDPAKYAVERRDEPRLGSLGSIGSGFRINLLDAPRAMAAFLAYDSLGSGTELLAAYVYGEDVYASQYGLYGYTRLAAGGMPSDFPAIIYTPEACQILGATIGPAMSDYDTKGMIDIQYCGRVLALGSEVEMSFPPEGGVILNFPVPHGLPELVGRISAGTFLPGDVSDDHPIQEWFFIWRDATSLQILPPTNVIWMQNNMIERGHTHLVLFPTIVRGGSGLHLAGSDYSIQFAWDPDTAIRSQW